MSLAPASGLGPALLGRLAPIGPLVEGGPEGEAERDLDARWAASGAMALTGPEAEPWLAPPQVTASVLQLGRLLSGLPGAPVVDPLALLGERAALAGLARAGRTSCGGATRLLAAGDGWVAASLARPDDRQSLPAWLGIDPGGDEVPWEAVGRAVAGRRVADVVDQANLLGLAVSAAGSVEPVGPAIVAQPLGGPAVPASPLAVSDALVVDLSSLWAGPLCAQLLGLAGARVVKVEDPARPDGAREGPAAFYDLLHAGHQSVALDLGSSDGRRDLGRLLAAADVVIEASRPRALAQLGFEPAAVAVAGRYRAWVSITGYGRAGPAGQRVAFGDDAAVAGGLWAGPGPWFCADAVADPLTGMAAAAAALSALAAGGRWLLDVALAEVAAAVAGGHPGWRPGSARPDLETAPPRARTPAGRAPALGVDTESVLAGLGRVGRGRVGTGNL